MYDKVHFEGAWKDDGILVVAAAIRRAEGRLRTLPGHTHGMTWVCARENIDGSVLYVASRFGYHPTLRALTAEMLARRIDAFGESAVPYADPKSIRSFETC